MHGAVMPCSPGNAAGTPAPCESCSSFSACCSSPLSPPAASNCPACPATRKPTRGNSPAAPRPAARPPSARARSDERRRPSAPATGPRPARPGRTGWPPATPGRSTGSPWAGPCSGEARPIRHGRCTRRWQAFAAVPAGAAEIPALLLMAEALGRLDRPAQQIAGAGGGGGTGAGRRALARGAGGGAPRRGPAGRAASTRKPDAEPPRACLQFTVPPARRTDWQPARLGPRRARRAGPFGTREGDALCAAGLPPGEATRLVLRAGLPGEDGLRLLRDTPVRVAMPNRRRASPSTAARFILPRGQAPRVGPGHGERLGPEPARRAGDGAQPGPLRP